MKKTIAVLPGDGIGPEIMKEGLKVLDVVAKKRGHEFTLLFADFGGVAYDKYGHPFPDETKAICDKADAILKGPVGGPKYDKIGDVNLRPERGAILPLRKRYDTFANLRPVKAPPALFSSSPLKPEVIGEGVNIMMIRELVGGIYFGKNDTGTDENGKRYAIDEMKYEEDQVVRIARLAFDEAVSRRSKLYNIHKANVLTCSVFWNEIVENVRRDYTDVLFEHMLVDNAAFQLMVNPRQFNGVMLFENMMGDILTDQAGGILGSLGLMPSACIGPEKSYYEPAHGSAPNIACQNIANPYSMIGSVAFMLDKSFNLKEDANAIWNALFNVFGNGYRTMELKTKETPENKIVSTDQFGDLVCEEIEKCELAAVC